MEFTTVFDIAESGYRSWGFAANGLIFIFVGIVLFFSHRILLKLNLRKTSEETRNQKWFKYSFLGIGILWTVGAFFLSYSEFLLLNNSACKTIEGQVENFDPMPLSGHKQESYTVKNIPFQYSDFRITNGFNNTAAHGGPVKSDSFVRICYVPGSNNNAIVRLEIRNFTGPTKDYSGGFGFFDMFENLKKNQKSGNFPKLPENNNKMMNTLEGIIFPLVLADTVFYFFMFLPFYRVSFKAKTLEHAPAHVFQSILDTKKHSFKNLTAKYDVNGILWAKAYGIEFFDTFGCVLKMRLSLDKSQIVKSEIRFSSLLAITFILMGFLGIQFFQSALEGQEESMLKFFPYIIFLMLAGSYWTLVKRFEGKIRPLLTPENQ